MLVDQILNRIRMYRRQGGYSILAFANLTGASETALRSMDEKNWNPQVRTIRKCEGVIPPEFMANANDDAAPSSDPSAACTGRGDNQHQAA